MSIKLTQYSHGGGCGCKIAPQVLHEILQTNNTFSSYPNLLVGNSSKDDAAVYDLKNGTALIATTDFFMPIVDDPFLFGQIASANAISDIYAMGGTPLLAIAILGWPIKILSTTIAQQVLEGARAICAEANIPLAGGHSIDSPEPIFGLAVNGLVQLEHLKKNNTAQEGDYIFLSKPIGVGILTTAQKKGILQKEHYEVVTKQLRQLNICGETLGKINEVHALTDVTGFGLLGHLVEMGDGSKLSASIYYSKLPLLQITQSYIKQGILPGATQRNWQSYGDKISIDAAIPKEESLALLPDPQTNGGLLIAVAPTAGHRVEKILKDNGWYSECIGVFEKQQQHAVAVHL